MPQRLFIAEKPALGRAIATALATLSGERQSPGRGFIEVGSDCVTWTIGHAYDTAEPGDYSSTWDRWNLDVLPMIPERWKLVPNADIADQIAVLKERIRRYDHFVNVGDAEREGQLIVDEILLENGIDPFSPKVSRIWVSSFVEKDVATAVAGAFPNDRKRNLYEAAVARQRADWLLGMNMSRVFGLLIQLGGARGFRVSVGRVQTPTLKLVVDRDRQIEAFKAVDHFAPSITFVHENGTFKAAWQFPPDTKGLDPEGRLLDKAVATALVARIAGKTGTIESYAETPKSTSPPLPFALSTLQKACSQKFGLTAQQTLDVAQELYEKHKAITYPRSDSQHLPNSIHSDEAAGILRNLAGVRELGDAAGRADPRRKSPAFDDKKVTDHHGIIPTSEASASKLAAMGEIERKVFLLIARTFVAQFHPDFRHVSSIATVLCEGERFRATGTRVVDQGWKMVFGAEEADEEEEAEGTLPSMKQGDRVDAKAGSIDPKRTKPPVSFDDGTLIEAMAKIHLYVQDPEVRRRLRENDGIGTEATRASMIEKLIRAKYLDRRQKGKRKILVSTEAGRQLVDLLPSDLVAPDTTAMWESFLKRVESGEFTLAQFMDRQTQFVRKRVQTAIAAGAIKVEGFSIEPLDGHGGECPQCGAGRLVTQLWPFADDYKGRRFLRCDNWVKDRADNCRYRTRPEGFKERAPLEGEGVPCPACGKGTLKGGLVRKEGPNKGRPFLMCSEVDREKPEGCQHFEWKDETPCPVCSKGVLKRGVVRKDGPNKGRPFAMCSAVDRGNPEGCQHFAWLDEKPAKGPKIKGEGEPCTVCGKGTLVRRTGKTSGKPFLSCSNWKAGASDNCDNRIFPDDGGRRPAAGAGTAPSARPRGGRASQGGGKRSFAKAR
ncbi:DNA topoisomerase 3 [Methylobacterium hispanicum]|uniref:DNA topoisomerase n=1 Tax=Methylobacterium hispanicum TaxID=270350 RepID=A0AAV4ZPC0_9HYPH|nr:DNA topoisomerase 3 [Methylobacterium hispanicum]GJD89415.1 DNA topoisomerase 3 [Methylobacterium hispanicum]